MTEISENKALSSFRHEERRTQASLEKQAARVLVTLTPLTETHVRSQSRESKLPDLYQTLFYTKKYYSKILAINTNVILQSVYLVNILG